MSKQYDILLAFSYYDHRLHSGAAAFAKEQGWHLTAEVLNARKTPWGWKGDGIIAKVYGGDALSRFVEEAGVPVVNIGQGIDGRFPMVLIDEHSLIDRVITNFSARGFENYAWFGPHPELHEAHPATQDLPNRPRLFSDKLEELGFRCSMLDWRYHQPRGTYSWEEERNWLKQQLMKAPKPLAVLCQNDNKASYLLQLCMECSISVPNEVSILGQNNDPLVCETSPVPISSIDTNMEGRAYLAAQLLQQQLEGESIPQATFVPIREVVCRQSSNTLVIKHPRVSEAVQYMWEHYQEPISITDVAAVAQLSTRGLHKAFIKHLDRSPLQELQRIRLIRAQDLLRDSSLRIHEIASLTGHENVKNLYRAFTHHCALTPRAYRLRAREQKASKLPGPAKPDLPPSLFSRTPGPC